MDGIRVLYVEDNSATRDSFYRILKKRYFENVDCAEDGQQGLELFTRQPEIYDFVISDITMPKLDGIAMIEQMKRIKPELITMLISGKDDRMELIRAIEMGVDRFLIKPINYQMLDVSLSKVLGQLNSLTKTRKLEQERTEATRLMEEYKKAVDESTIFSIGDLSGRIKYANRQFREVSGYSLEELVGQPHSIVRHPDMPKEAFAQMWETLHAKKVWKGMVKNRKKNGDPYYVDATIVPITDKKGEVIEYAGIRDDITDLVLKERELEKLKDSQRKEEVSKALTLRSQEVLDVIPLPALFLKKDSRQITQTNGLFQELFLREWSLPAASAELFEKEEGYLYDDEEFPLEQRYELAGEEALVLIDGREFYLNLAPKQEGFILTLFEKR